MDKNKEKILKIFLLIRRKLKINTNIWLIWIFQIIVRLNYSATSLLEFIFRNIVHIFSIVFSLSPFIFYEILWNFKNWIENIEYKKYFRIFLDMRKRNVN